MTPDRVHPTGAGTPSRWRWAVAVAAGLVYAWIAAGFRAFTTTENVLVAIPIVVVFVVAAWHGSDRPTRQPGVRARGTAVWVVLLAMLVAWEMLQLFSSPREDHPTLSSIADTLMSVHAGRAAMFALWLVAGAGLAMARPGDGR